MTSGISPRKLAPCFQSLFRTLPKTYAPLLNGIVRYVLEGDDPSVLPMLQDPVVRRVWRRHDQAGLFADMALWRMEQMRRLGEALAALKPSAGHLFGSRKSPPWLRHIVTFWFACGAGEQPLDMLLRLVAEEPEPVTCVLGILLCPDPGAYGQSNSFHRFAGVQPWLEGAATAVIAAAGGFDTAMRVELAMAVRRFHILPPYLDWLIESAAGPAEKLRTAARQALAGAEGTEAKEPDRARADGPDGFMAVDGTWVAAPERKALPEPSPLPTDVLQRLVPALEAFNTLFQAGKQEAATLEHGNWTNRYDYIGPENLDALAALAEQTDNATRRHYDSAVDWLRCRWFTHPAIAGFFNDPRLGLYHLVRITVKMTNGNFPWIFSDWNGAAGDALQRRLQASPDQGAELRTILRLWSDAGGSDYITARLLHGWPLPDIGLPLWPVLCGRFARFDQALGLVPQSGIRPVQLLPALELLGLFPKLPERYRAPLMLMAHDPSRQLRNAAHRLLQQTPHLGEAIAAQLRDGRQETRARAAKWLGTRDEHDQIPAIRAALAKERSDLARAAMITALSRMGEDVADYFSPATLLKDAKAGLARARPKGLDWFPLDRLPALAWADGTPVDPLLPQWWLVLAAKLKQPGGNALMTLWLDRLAPGQAQRLGWMVLSLWIDEDTRRPTDEEANAYANEHVDALLQNHLASIQRWPHYADYLPTDRAAIFADLKREKAGTYLGSAVESKGILALAARVHGTDAAQAVRAFLKEHGGRTSQAKALLDVLAAIGTGAALQALLSAANRSRQRSVQDHAAALIDQIAERNGWSAVQLADRTIPTGGFDADGTQELSCGKGRSYRLHFAANDKVVILNAEGREVKALPGPRADEDAAEVAAAKKQLATARKEVKQTLATQTERLWEAMAVQRSWEREEWRNFIASHPLVGRLAARLIWQGLDAADEPAGTFRPLGDGSYTNAADDDVDLADCAQVRLAHSSLLDGDTIAAWRTHLADYAVQPPFDQILRTLPVLSEAQAGAHSIDDREGWRVENLQLRGQAARLGYQRGQIRDGEQYVTYEKNCREAGLIVEITAVGNASDIAALQSLSFRRLNGEDMRLSSVPPILLAESWQDLHDMADRGSGYDPEWKEKTGE